MASFNISSDGTLRSIEIDSGETDIVIPKVINGINLTRIDVNLSFEETLNSISVEDNIELNRVYLYTNSSPDLRINNVTLNCKYRSNIYGNVNLFTNLAKTIDTIITTEVQNVSCPNCVDILGLTINYVNGNIQGNYNFPELDKDRALRVVSYAVKDMNTEYYKNLTVTTKQGTFNLLPNIKVSFNSRQITQPIIYLQGENASLPQLPSTETRIFKGWTNGERLTVINNSSDLFKTPSTYYPRDITLYADYDDLCKGGTQQVDLPFLEYYPEETPVNLSQRTKDAISNIHNKFAMFR